MSAQYDQLIYNGAITQGATPALAQLVTAQARHESGNYSSHQTSVNCNVFGFKYSPNSIYCTVGNISPEGDPYAHYDDVGLAVQDYITRWMSKPSHNGGTRLDEFNAIQAGDTETFARTLKSYDYYSTPDGSTDEQVIQNYIQGLNAALTRIQIVAFIAKNGVAIGFTVLGIFIASYAAYIYILNKRKVI